MTFLKNWIPDVLQKYGTMGEEEFNSLIPYAKQIRNRYTILNTVL